MIRPRDGREHVLDDETCSLLLDILVNSSANPHVVRPVVLLLTEISNTYQPAPAAAPAAPAAAPAAPAAVAGEARGAEAGGGAAAGQEKAITVKAAAEETEGRVDDGGNTATVIKLDPDRDPRWVMRSCVVLL